MLRKSLLALIVPAVMLLCGAAPASAKPHRAVASAHAGPAKAKHRVAHHKASHKKAKPHRRHTHH